MVQLNKNEVKSISLLLLTEIANADNSPARGAISKELYGKLKGKMELDTYNKIIGMLIAGGFIKHTNGLLHATPKGFALAQIVEKKMEKVPQAPTSAGPTHFSIERKKFEDS
jgi:hypothetical protein